MIIKTTLIALTLAAMSAPMAFAKGHDQGFGNMSAGTLPAGAVGQQQRPNETTGPYGIRDAKVDAQDGISGKSEMARAKMGNHQQ